MEAGYKFAVVFVVSLVVVVLPEAFIGGGLLQYRVDEAFATIERGFPKHYQLDQSTMPSRLKGRFVQMYQDEDTTYFLRNSSVKANNLARAVWQTLVKTALRLFCTKTTIMGLLGHSRMFVFSWNQFLTLIGVNETWRADTLLDIGAGDGGVTQRMAKFFTHVNATEVSTTMRWRLQEKGFNVVDPDDWYDGTRKYDVISVLNVLDRCSRPLTMLGNISESLTPNGVAIVSLVLPYKPYVEAGAPNHKPTEKLPIKGKTFQKQLFSVIENILEPAGFEVLRFTKMPYFCEGNLRSAFLKLDDAVFVLRKRVLPNR